MIYTSAGEIPAVRSGVLIHAGTRVILKSVQTSWDFENGDRLTIRGTIPVVGLGPEEPFLFEKFSASPVDGQKFIIDAFGAC